MKTKVSIETDEYRKLVNNIESAAADCQLKDELIAAAENLEGTAVTELLARHADRVNDITKKYQKQASTSLVKTFNGLAKSIEKADKHAASNIKLKK
ncbi:MAG: hypothetical protein IKW81_03205 [Pseudobutyrivibrio sp.]|nr:hypothetical protein [Pseudobutyrivibrio sp.]